MMSTSTSQQVKVLVITGFGLNCERETSVAFQQAGATAEMVHLNDVIAGRRKLEEFHVLALIGGFSFGDHLGAGTVFANRLKHRLAEDLRRFVEDGRIIIGICNGFQTLTRLGLAPCVNDELFVPEVALAQNQQGTFRDDWVTVKTNPHCPCPFLNGIERLPVPVRHAEGRFVARDEAVLQKLEANNHVAMRYVDPEDDQPAGELPANPNGSVNAIAAVCDSTGRRLGLMPHPEAHLTPYNHPHWERSRIAEFLPDHGAGQVLFNNIVHFAAENLEVVTKTKPR